MMNSDKPSDELIVIINEAYEITEKIRDTINKAPDKESRAALAATLINYLISPINNTSAKGEFLYRVLNDHSIEEKKEIVQSILNHFSKEWDGKIKELIKELESELTESAV